MLTNLHPNEYGQEFHYYLFAVKFKKCFGSCNKAVPNEAEYLNLSLFNMITGINESKTLAKHITCEFKCRSMVE